VFLSNQNLPPAIRRLRRWYFLAALLPLPAAVLAHYRISLGNFVFCFPLAMFATIVLLRALERRMRQRAARVGYRLCPECVYPLEGDAGTCPECGRVFTIKELEFLWKRGDWV
jgi:hypothetical protein